MVQKFLASLVCFIIFGATANAQGKLQLPKGAPRFFIVAEMSKDHVTLKELDPMSEGGTSHKLPLKSTEIYEASGRKLLAEDLPKRVTIGTIVLVADHTKLESAFLSVLREDAVILVDTRLRALVTTDCEDFTFDTKLTNIFQGKILPSRKDMFNFDPKWMWHSSEAVTGWVSVQVAFSREMELTGLAIHSQHSGQYHDAKAVRVSVLEKDGKFRMMSKVDLQSVDETVAIPKTLGRVWRLEFQAGDGRHITLRGLRFFSGDKEPFPPFVVSSGGQIAKKEKVVRAPLKAIAPKNRKELADLLEEARTQYDLPMLAAAIVGDDGPRLVAAVGVRKRGEEAMATDDDHLHLGSDTKPITAWLIAWLIEQGLLGWDTSLADIFPELAKDWPETHRKITVTQLLTHHSGLPANYPGDWWSIPVEGTPREQRLVMMKKLGTIKLEGKPGAKFLYSNLGYAVLGAVTERRGKASWEELLEKHVFGPLDMKGVGHGPMGKEGKILQPWQHSDQGRPIAPKWNHDNPPVMGPAGRLHCSMPAWSKFIAELLRSARGGKGLLKAETYAMMFDTPYKDHFYCRGGWGGERKQFGKGLVLAHDGSNGQNYCTALLRPDINLAVLVATNQGGDDAQNACVAVREALVKGLTARKKK